MSLRCGSTLGLVCRNLTSTRRTSCHRLAPKYSAVRWASTQPRQWSTPLAKNLAEAITTTGPISIAQYTRQCLTLPGDGYYATRSNDQSSDQFGKAGDFVTSPEISQIFGELVGIWFLSEWISQGRPSAIQLVELGPGRGTLMDDILRTLSSFKVTADAISTVYLVESSPSLREAQRKLLCGDNAMQPHPMGHTCKSQRLAHVDIVWVEDLKFIDQESIETPFVVAHEFFDALPIHAFQATQAAPRKTSTLATPNTIDKSLSRGRTPQPGHNEWRELLVSPTAPPSIISPPSTPLPEFELTLSSAPTHYSRILPSISKRYSSMLLKTGSTIEISPESLTTMQALAGFISARNNASNPAAPTKQPRKRTDRASGATLVIDYGPADTVPISTLRGIQKHKRVSPFLRAGQVDISADVDFGALAEAALTAAPDVEVHGPVEQANWLAAMGGRERCDILLNSKDATADVKDRIESGWKRLIERGPNGMGRLYKFMAVLPLSNGRRPVGFGGDVGAD